VTVVRPEFEPTLPALVRGRIGLPERTTVLLLVLALAVAGAAAVFVRPRVDGESTLVHGSEPAFNLAYANGALREAEPRAGELARLEGARGRQSVTITVRPLELPPYDRDAAHGLLPVYASGHIERLAGELGGFKLRQQHRARINDAPGYEIRFQSGSTIGIDTLLVPDELEERGAVLLSLRRTVDGRPQLGKREQEFARDASEAFRSFAYGTARP
jgi:hypothetical protein